MEHFDGRYLRVHAELAVLGLVSGLAFLNTNEQSFLKFIHRITLFFVQPVAQYVDARTKSEKSNILQGDNYHLIFTSRCSGIEFGYGC